MLYKQDEDDLVHGDHLVGWTAPLEHRPSRFTRAGATIWRWRKLAAVLVLLAVAVWVFAPQIFYGPVVEATPVIKADFVQTVVASGHVEAPFRVNVASQITGVVA